MSVTLISPSEGDTWTVDETVTVAWYSTVNASAVDLYLEQSGSLSSIIAVSQSATGRYVTIVPDEMTPGSYSVVVSNTDVQDSVDIVIASSTIIGYMSVEDASAAASIYGAKEVPPMFLKMAESIIDQILKRLECDIPKSVEDDGTLANAQLGFVLDFMQKAGLIALTTGDLAKQTQGRVSTEMQRTYPMFLIRGMTGPGGQEGFLGLVSHMSWWQVAVWLVEGYADGTVKMSDIIKLVQDANTRGNKWKEPEYDEAYPPQDYQTNEEEAEWSAWPQLL